MITIESFNGQEFRRDNDGYWATTEIASYATFCETNALYRQLSFSPEEKVKRGKEVWLTVAGIHRCAMRASGRRNQLLCGLIEHIRAPRPTPAMRKVEPLPDETITSPFDRIRHHYDDGREYWTGRELMPFMGYGKWENFEAAINRATLMMTNSGHDVEANLIGVRNSGTPRPQGGHMPAEDVHLSRLACYFVALNGDPDKLEVAAAQSYFVTQTRNAEMAALQPEDEFDTIIRIARSSQEAKRAANEGKSVAFAAMSEAVKSLKLGEANRALGVENSGRIDNIEGQHGWYGALAIAKMRGLPSNEDYLNRLGRRASKIGKLKGLTPGKVPHARYGTTNSWPLHVWDEALASDD